MAPQSDAAGLLPRRCYLGADLAREAATSAEVSAVDAKSPAEQAGLEPGDVIVRIAGVAVKGALDLVSTLRAVRAGTSFELEVERSGSRQLLRVPARPLPLEALSRGQIALDQVETASGRLRALLSLPESDGPVPIVYLLQNANWTSIEHPFDSQAPWRQLVDVLTSAGFATYRVERSGVGDSEGPACTELDFAAELAGFVAGARRLSTLPISESIHLFGWSLGGMIAPLVAREVEVQSIAVFGSSARRCSEIAEQIVPLLAGSAGRINGRNADFFRQLEATDLREAWRRVQAPVLALHGELDRITSLAEAQEIAPARAVEVPATQHDLSGAGGSGLSSPLGELLIEFYRSIRA